MPRALVTGATGLLGSHLVERLHADGWEVRALVRDAAVAAWLAPLGAGDLHTGDVLDPTRIAAAARGCDVIFHAAALITPRGGWEQYRATNVDGTRNAVAAAQAAGARLLQVSSVAVYGAAARYAGGAGGTSEDAPFPPLPDTAWYARSKRESELVALEAHRRGEIWATAVRPDVLYGRRDRQFVPRIGRLVRRGVVPVLGGGRATLAVVHAGNVADAAILAATRDVAGGRAYNTANDFDVTAAEFFRLAAQGLGRTVRLPSVPLPVARVAVAAVGAALRATGARGLATMLASSLDFGTRDNPFTSARAVRELGWTPRIHPRDGVPDAFRWWAAQCERR